MTTPNLLATAVQASPPTDGARPGRESPASATPTAELQVLRLRLQNIQCAIDLCFVERVFPLVAVQQVPGGPQYLAGLMNYRGESLALVDLGIWLGLTVGEPYSLDTPIILCHDSQTRVGFVVSEVLQVVTALAGSVQMENIFAGTALPFIAALNSESGQTLLLDMQRIMQLDFSAASLGAP